VATKKKKLRKPGKKAATKKAATKKTTRKKAPSRKVKEQESKAALATTGKAAVRRARFSEIRRRAGQDYVMDPDQRSVEFWHGHPDRPYSDEVALRTFREWAYTDEWNPKRTHLWEELEWRVHEAMKEKLFEQRITEINARTEERDAMFEYLRPRRDAAGEIERYPLFTIVIEKDKKGEDVEVQKPHPFGGLPVLPLPFKDMGDAVRSAVKFEQHLMTMRGESTSRTEHITRSDPAKAGMLIDPVASAADIISDDDIHAMSRALLRQRQPELALEAEFSLVEEEENNG